MAELLKLEERMADGKGWFKCQDANAKLHRAIENMRVSVTVRDGPILGRREAEPSLFAARSTSVYTWIAFSRHVVLVILLGKPVEGGFSVGAETHGNKVLRSAELPEDHTTTRDEPDRFVRKIMLDVFRCTCTSMQYMYVPLGIWIKERHERESRKSPARKRFATAKHL